jgi:hypothetical protein
MNKLAYGHIFGLHSKGRPVEVACATMLRRELPVFSHDYIDSALHGDAEAAGYLSITDNQWRPFVLVCLYACCRLSDGFKVALSAIWDHDGPDVLATIDAPLLRDMFECGGHRPCDLPKLVTIYRGGIGSYEQLRKGWSWTTERGVAAWFALRWGGVPLVIETKIKTPRILHASDDRNERELVVPGVRNASVSGTLEDWQREAPIWRASVGMMCASYVATEPVQSVDAAMAEHAPQPEIVEGTYSTCGNERI